MASSGGWNTYPVIAYSGSKAELSREGLDLDRKSPLENRDHFCTYKVCTTIHYISLRPRRDTKIRSSS